MEIVEVVVGIVIKGNKFLVERRRWNEKIDPWRISELVITPLKKVWQGATIKKALILF